MEIDKAFTPSPTKEREEPELSRHNDNPQNPSVKQYIKSMYEEFKKCFEIKNFSRIEIIIKNIGNVDPESNILNSIYGHLCLFKGQGLESYKYLFLYSRNCKSTDLWAISTMALFNHFAGEDELAIQQFTKVLSGSLPTKCLIFYLICAIKSKKRLGFFDSAYGYLERLQAVPDGFKMILLIKLEMIHILILKNMYEKAHEEIAKYMEFSRNDYIKRLFVYLLYLEKN